MTSRRKAALAGVAVLLAGVAALAAYGIAGPRRASPDGAAARVASAVPAAVADEPPFTLPGDSLFQLDLRLLDDAGSTLALEDYRGSPLLVALFYGACPSACPLLVSDITRLEAALAPEARSRLRVLLVSFDAEKDTPEVLAALREKHGMDPERWRLASAPDEQVRELAAVLGVKYRRLPDGHYVHSSVITLLDAEGVARGRWEGYLRDAAGPAREVERVAVVKR